MPKKNQPPKTPDTAQEPVIRPQPITDAIEKNFMPYAMSVIVARAIPEIDGFKPAHRKLLYTMYRMGLLGSANRTKSTNVVGETMKLNPHGDAAIYDTMARLTRGNETLIHPFIDSKGAFGKHYSSDMVCAASRYTEVRLDPFCHTIFDGIDADAVDMTDNYDGTLKEPKLLPTAFPNILVSPNKGIAVAIASSICSFNLGEVCDGAIQLLRNPDTTVDMMLDIIKAPDFQGGAYIVYNREKLREVYRTGVGPIRLRARWSYDKAANCIDITQIPYSTAIEPIIKKITQLVKEGKLREITDVRDEVGINGCRITIDLRRGTDPDKLMARLFRMTPLEDTFDCNFNVLVDGTPRQLGLIGILNEWIRFRIGCVRRELTFGLEKKKNKLHLLLGLGKILLDIDKAIRIVRETAREQDVVPNLMAGFSIDQTQAEYIAEIKLRNLNREYILNRLKEIESLQSEIADLEDLIGSEARLKTYIARQLKEIKAKYGKPRQTQLIYDDELPDYTDDDFIENYNVRLILTREGYFKKITLLSLRGNDEQKLKDGDTVRVSCDAANTDELLFFSDKAQVYKAKVSDFDTVKASDLGDFIPAKLGFDEGERTLTMVALNAYEPSHNMIFLFRNGKGVRIPLAAYQTKTNRRRLTGAYSDVCPPVAAFVEREPMRLMLLSNVKRALVISSDDITLKTTRSSQGAALMTLKKGQELDTVLTETEFSAFCSDVKRYVKANLPAAGTLLAEADPDQLQIKF